MNNSVPCELTNLSIVPPVRPEVLSVQKQIATLPYQYMRMMLIMSAILFIYVVFNNLFREDNDKTVRIGRAFDSGCIVVSSFLLVISITYFTGWL